MNKLQELIDKLCPDGVSNRKFNDVAQYVRGVSYGKSKEINNGGNGHKLLRANNITLESNTINYDDVKIIDFSVKIKDNQKLIKNDILICAGSGSKEHIGKVAFIEEDIDYTFGGFMGVIRANEEILNPRYLFHIMTSPIFKEHLFKVSNSSTINNINNDTWKDFAFPVPPLPVQEEIVRILDTFTELTAELTAELSAELKARQKQFEYYRNKLFEDIKEKSVIMKVQDISKNICSGGTPLTSVSEYYGGDIPWLRTQEINFDEIWDTGVKITDSALKNSSAKMIPANCVIVAMYGATVGKVGINKIPLTTNQACCNIEVDEQVVNYKYLFYWLSERYEYIKSLGQGSQTNINSKIVKELEVPIPSLIEQERIVGVLDKLDKIANSISEGLPYEIKLRQQQYEYYRDKLLTFKKI